MSNIFKSNGKYSNNGKGDFYSKFYSKEDVVIGNSKQYRNISERWNIYEEIISDGKDYISVFQNTQEICKSLFADLVDNNSSNPFFPIAARDLLASIIIALIKKGVTPNNSDLKRFIDSSTIDDLRSLLQSFPDLASVASYIGGKSGSQAQGVLSEMYSVTRDVLNKENYLSKTARYSAGTNFACQTPLAER